MVKMCASAWRASCSAMWVDKALICATRVDSTASSARVVWARWRRGRRCCHVVRRGAGGTARRVGAAAVTDAGQPGGQALGREPVGAVLAVEAGQEGQADRAVELGEQTDGAGEHNFQVRAQLVGHADPVATRSLRARQVRRKATVARAVGDQRAQPGTVGTQGVGEYIGVEPVVLVAGRTVASAQVLELVRADHHHGDHRCRAACRRPGRRGVRSRLRRSRAVRTRPATHQDRRRCVRPRIGRLRGRDCRRSIRRDHRAPSRFRRLRRWSAVRAGWYMQ